MKSNGLGLALLLASTGITFAATEDNTSAVIGQSERVYPLASENTDVRGLAFDDRSPEAPRLFTLDGSGKIFAYRLEKGAQAGLDQLQLLQTHARLNAVNNTIIRANL